MDTFFVVYFGILISFLVFLWWVDGVFTREYWRGLEPPKKGEEKK